jgi:hypothetical protein
MNWKKGPASSVLNYCRWFRDVITANGKDVLEFKFFTDEVRFHLSGYVNSQNSRVWSAINSNEIKDYTITWSEGWCVAHHIMQLVNRHHILPEYYQLAMMLWSDSLSLHWTFKGRRNCPRVLPTGRCYCTHSLCFHDVTARCVRGQKISKDIWPPRSPTDYSLWGVMKDATC